jgi:ribonuclease HI
MGGRYESGGERHTTNQRMELTAVLRAVEYFTALDTPLLIVSDSQYVVNCFKDRWHVKWHATNWKHGQVKNRDLWEPLIELALAHGVQFEWIKGHSGDPGNEMADRLASAAVPRW